MTTSVTTPGHTVPTDLNAMQRQAVLYMDGPCLVLAGAGSGKTRVITQKIAYLLRECGYTGRQVVALTFTNKAAREMNERIRALVDPKLLRGLTVSTFHSLGLRMLREEAQHVGLKPRFSILDANDALAIIQELLATTDKGRLRSVQQEISLWKNALMGPDQAERAANSPSQIEAARIYRDYAATLIAYQSVDFDDLIRLPAQLMQDNQEVCERWQRRVQYLLVDEYQDTNLCQYQLVRSLTGQRNMFTVVGDDDQAIYAWRGATVENLAQLPKDYPELKVIKLEQNYRSVQRILQAANNVIGNNPVVFGKKLWSDLGFGEPIQVHVTDDEQHEADSVAMRISAERFERQAEWRDFAVLYRGNHQARIFEQALRNLRIPYTISGGQSFFDKAEIRDILSYLRIVANEDDDPAFIRAATTPRRGIGQATLQVLGQFAAEQKLSLFAAVSPLALTDRLPERQLEPLRVFAQFIGRIQQRADRVESEQEGHDTAVSELLDELLRAIDYERYLYDMFDERPAQTRWENVLELITWLKSKAADDELSLNDLVQRVALITMLERGEDDDPDAVKLSTLHASKGLEYPHVFLVGVEEGLLPHIGRDDEDIDPDKEADILAQRIQEERRLMYVGITRAQRSLRLSWCKKRRRARENLVRERSRFIDEMKIEDPGAQEDPAQAALSPKQRLDMLKNLLNKS
ncbi:UvrD-helicase domain-containing protein [Alcaligenes ammonioxydans]|jgi:ATP-dependent DNA helicase Rep|uniref:UvrD-helicase domain-containing protein n=1 Tax=Alcaligenes TaxID=507 RepID=UPI000750182C|nr:UvrD-helicase domain-containing protein [Alcaligenes ammonioxydans]MCH1879009.1 UvrD-helicase domain-containing protein [Alcaligenes ammonioxydans]QBH19843.1 ATP-dependent DNA helicase Rep [Alcaligenes faecalis]